MTSSKNRRESAWKSRKENQQPHGEINLLPSSPMKEAPAWQATSISS